MQSLLSAVENFKISFAKFSVEEKQFSVLVEKKKHLTALESLIEIKREVKEQLLQPCLKDVENVLSLISRD